MNHFNEGDTLRVIDTERSGNYFTEGQVVTVAAARGVTTEGSPVISLEGHSGMFTTDQFELVAPAPVKPRAGERAVLGTQVGGSHYTDCAIQPIEYIWANNLAFCEGNVVKYVTRWKTKGGVKDLKKARHHLSLLIEEAEKQEANGVVYGLQG